MRLIASSLAATDFFHQAHQNIWQVRSSLSDAGVPCDVTAVIDAAKKFQLDLGGTEYVMGLLQDDVLKTTSEVALQASAKRIKEFSVRRTFRETLVSALSLTDGGTQSCEDVMTFVDDSIQNVKSGMAANSAGPKHVMHFVSAVIDQVAMRMDGEAPNDSVMTGFQGLDRITGGLTDGDLAVLAARPSMGKTAVSLAISEHVGDNTDRTVLYFSTEQGGRQLSNRMIASRGRLDAMAIRRGELSEDDFSRFCEGAEQVGKYDMHIDEESGITLPEIRARARTFAAKNKGKKILIVVDYLQNVAAHIKADPRTVIGEICVGLKRLGKELGCPVLVLAQLSRGLEARTNKRPMMSDLAESGKIEQDADIIMFLYRDEYYNPDTKEPGITEVIVGKNRDGAVGMTKLTFDKRTQHFEDMYHE